MTIAEIKRMFLGAIHCANRVLLAYKRANGTLYTNDTFTTLCMTAITQKNEFIYAYSGDSRIYLIRKGQMLPITKDHTEAQKLCDEGKISKDQIFSHPDRDILTSALGFNDPKIDIMQATLQKEDIVLMATDGVHKTAQPNQILELVQQAGDCKTTCEGLLEMGNFLGGPDNMAVSVTYIY